jgi:hypothetical protein
MTKLWRLSFVVLAVSLFAGSAGADPNTEAKKAEAQKTINENKIKGCEALKKTLAKNKLCPDQGAAATKVTCSVAGFDEIVAINNQCVAILKEKGNAAKAASTAAKEKKTSTCKATDAGGAVLAEATTEKSSDCRKQIKAAVTKAGCTPGVKKVDYTFALDAQKPMKSLVICPRVKK